MGIRWHQEQLFAKDMPDDEWMEIVGPRGWVVLSQDRKFHVRENELLAVKQHNIRCFYLPCASDDRWVSLCHIVRRHEKMMELAVTIPPPFIYELKGNGRLYKVKI